MTLSEKIVDFRAKYDLSQSEFAKMAKVSTQTIYNIENGYQEPSRLTEAKIKRVIEERED